MTNKRPQGIKIDLSRLQSKPASICQQKTSVNPRNKKNGSEDQSFNK